MATILSPEIQEKLSFYEKVYFSLDNPVPFRQGIMVYPVLVKDYYTFYSLLPCLTMDKNTKKVKMMKTNVDPFHPDVEMEVEVEVANPKGISMSYVSYLCEMMLDKEYGPTLTQQVMHLFELVLHLKNGLFCPNCHSEHAHITFEEAVKAMSGMTPEEKQAYLVKISKCPDCGQETRQIFSIKQGKINKLCIYDYEFSSKDFDELTGIITHGNILGYDDDIYIDPDLKADLDKKRKLQNKDYTSPTLEKQIVVAMMMGFTEEEIRNMPMRKLSFLLKVNDAQKMYYAQIQASMSGFVKFKKQPEHYLYSEDNFGRDIKKEIMSVDDLKKKVGN